jgi:extradiol dioxygenase family protein
MHRSRLAGFIVDCRTSDLDAAATFWSSALGMPSLGREGDAYVRLDATARDMVVEVQSVAHESRVHLDIETDDVRAEVARLEKLGARRVEDVRSWCVMASPTGQRFCVVRAKVDLTGAAGARVWE